MRYLALALILTACGTDGQDGVMPPVASAIDPIAYVDVPEVVEPCAVPAPPVGGKVVFTVPVEGGTIVLGEGECGE